jgi:ribosomal protein S18 acetylase RimI-like enzyme
MYYVAVHPDFRERHFGLSLVSAAENWLLARKIPKAMMMVRESNLPVLDFYAKQGYAQSPVLVLEKWLEEKQVGPTTSVEPT